MSLSDPVFAGLGPGTEYLVLTDTATPQRIELLLGDLTATPTETVTATDTLAAARLDLVTAWQDGATVRDAATATLTPLQAAPGDTIAPTDSPVAVLDLLLVSGAETVTVSEGVLTDTIAATTDDTVTITDAVSARRRDLVSANIAPGDRTWRVGADARTFRVGADARTWQSETETRTWIVRAQTRTWVVRSDER